MLLRGYNTSTKQPIVSFLNFLSECNDQFVDSYGDNCAKYAAEGWCTLDGGYGSSWDSSWGTFENWTNADGESATVCKQCGCGGGN